ncbi:MAG: hypothetical protein ACRDJU_01035 [Actinomycetota bacterium]
MDAYIKDHEIPLVRFKKGDCKEDIARTYIDEAMSQGRFGVVMAGVAQEKDSVWRGWRNGGPDAHPHFEFSRQSVFPNFYYFYLYDAQMGPAFIKVSTYAPFSMWVGCNGHDWAKRQAEQDGLGYRALDNGFAGCDNPDALQRICDRFGASPIRTFFERWVHRLPSPFRPEDKAAGFFYELAFRQIELSDTRVFDRAPAGRAWLEATIREHLDLGRPDQVALVFSRRISARTPGRFATKVITRGVDPSLQIYYRSSKAKQYFKESKALRTETTVNDTHDFGVGRLITEENFQALKAAAQAANAALVELERSGETCAPDADTLQRVVLPSTEDGVAAPGLRFGDPRVVALLASLLSFSHIVSGFTNASLRPLVEGHLGRPYSSRQMSYDLRRLARKGFIAREKGTHRYRLTADGRRLAMFFTKTYTRVVTPTLAHLDPALPPEVSARSPVARAWHSLERSLDDLIGTTGMAA